MISEGTNTGMHLSKKSSNPDVGGDASVLKRAAIILELLSETRPSITAIDVETALNVSSATAYRYLSDLCEMGLLHRLSGVYAPGPKILELEYLIRAFDPILAVSKELMLELAAKSGCHVLLSRLYGQRLVNIFYAKAGELPDIPFVPGRPLPIFRGSQSRIVLAYIERRKIRRLYEAHPTDEWRTKMGSDWESFKTTLNHDRRAGYYVSRDELAPDTTGIAAPVFDEAGDPIGALSMTFASSSPPWVGEQFLINLVIQSAKTISDRISASVNSV